uniref:Uncharacterized protein n=1 Tax=Poecilia latipinna TaxID=48699 RepID=A0A3B3VJA9_9TELE
MFQQTPLHLSVRYRALSAVRLLISCGANVNAVDSSGMTPLHMAASILHQDIASSLISHGADVNMVGIYSHISTHTYKQVLKGQHRVVGVKLS